MEELDDAVKAAGSAATLVPLDMRDYDGFYRLAAALNERYKRLDVLVGNAAIGGQRSPLGHVMPPAWDEAMAVNVNGKLSAHPRHGRACCAAPTPAAPCS